MKLLFVVSMSICSLAFASDGYWKVEYVPYDATHDMKLISYKEVEDCKLPSTKECRVDNHGQEHCKIVLNDACKE